MVEPLVQDIRRNVSSAKRLILDKEVAFPEATPILATDGFLVQLWHQLSVVVYADQSVAGAVAGIRPWSFFNEARNPVTGVLAGCWVPGKSVEEVPLDYTVTQGPRILKIPTGVADRIFLQVYSVSGASPSWVRLGIFGDVPRAFSQAEMIVVGG